MILVVVWSFGAFSFFMVPYYLNTIEGPNFYILSIATSIAEIFAATLSLYLTNRYDSARVVSTTAWISAVGAVFILIL